jgi:hypothetical protein
MLEQTEEQLPGIPKQATLSSPSERWPKQLVKTMIELSKEQQKELNGPEPLAVNPETRQIYVLVRRDVYERLRALLEPDTVYTTADMLDSVLAADDAHDPYLAELQRKYGGVP